MSTPPDKVPIPKTEVSKLEAFLNDFAKNQLAPYDDKIHEPRRLDGAIMNPVAAKRAENLRELLACSPELKEQMQSAFEQGFIEKIEYLPIGAHAGGTFSKERKSVRLRVDALDPLEYKEKDPELVFTLGHEVRHALNTPLKDDAIGKTMAEAEKIAKKPGPTHDYTRIVAKYIQDYRVEEASANIAGFNALVSKLRNDNPQSTPTLPQIYRALPGRAADFIDRSGEAPKFEYRIKQGLTLDKSMMMPHSHDNLAAMGRYYFDKPPTEVRLGSFGKQDYRHYYGDQVLSRIGEIEKSARRPGEAGSSISEAPTITINLKQLVLQKSLLTSNLNFVDTSPTKITHAREPTASDAEATGKKPRLDAPKDPPLAIPGAKESSALYAQSLRAIDSAGPGSLGLHDRTEIDNAAAAMALQALKLGMRSIDGAFKNASDQLIAYEGDAKMDSSKRFAFDVHQAKTQPALESLAELAKVLQKTEPVVQQNKPPAQR